MAEVVKVSQLVEKLSLEIVTGDEKEFGACYRNWRYFKTRLRINRLF